METAYESTESILVNQLDHVFLQEEGSRRRYAPKDGAPGQILDIVYDGERNFGRGGSGTVHHIAFDTPSDESQLAVRERIIRGGLAPTQVLDRNLFSFYILPRTRRGII